jgi:hypothetical protein
MVQCIKGVLFQHHSLADIRIDTCYHTRRKARVCKKYYAVENPCRQVIRDAKGRGPCPKCLPREEEGGSDAEGLVAKGRDAEKSDCNSIETRGSGEYRFRRSKTRTKQDQQKLRSPHKRGWVRPSQRGGKKANGRSLSKEHLEHQKDTEESSEEDVELEKKRGEGEGDGVKQTLEDKDPDK